MLVSVCTLVYNHEKYIEESLTSSLNQTCNFDYEVVVGEDCSRDQSRKTLLDYKKQFGEKLRLLLPEKNLGMMGNFYATMDACTGKYIAFCEGDDFWNSTEKLQKQVDLLEVNPKIGLVFSNLNIKEKHRTIQRVIKSDPHYDLYPEELLVANSIATCTVVCRRDLLNEARTFIGDKRFAMGDYPLWLYIAQKSKIVYVDKPLATYRIVGGSATNQGYDKQLAFLESLQEVKTYFMERFEYPEFIQKRVMVEYLQKKLMLCFLAKNMAELAQCGSDLKALRGKLTLREKVYRIAGKNTLLSVPLRVYHGLYHRLRRE